MTRLLLICLLVLLPAWAQASTIFAPDLSGVTLGNIRGSQNGFAVPTQTQIDLLNIGWSEVVTGCVTGSSNNYCSGSIVSATDATGATRKMLLYRYEEGPATDSCCNSRETKLIKVFSQTVQDLWLTYFVKFMPVPSNTVTCTPNCPTTSTFHDTAAKQQYFKTSGGVSFVSDYFWGDRRISMAVQDASDTGTTTVGPSVSVAKQDGVWYCEEQHIFLNDVGSANGVTELYSNGTRTVVSSGRLFRTSSAVLLQQMELYRQNSGFQWRYEYGHTYSTARVGCGGTTTDPAPAVPTGVTIQ